MLYFLEPIKDADLDCIKFLPNNAKMNSVNIESGDLKDPGEPIESSSIGDKYHINIFKKLPSGKFTADSFDAILTCPPEYVSNLIKCGWYGAVIRKTTTSHEINEEMKSNMFKVLETLGGLVYDSN